MKRRVSALLVLSSFWILGCSSPEEEDNLPAVDCATVNVPRFAEVSAIAVCTDCHHSALISPQARNNAQRGYNFDSYEGAVNYATEMVEEVYEGSMPPPTATQLTESQKQQLYAWGLCGTPR